MEAYKKRLVAGLLTVALATFSVYSYASWSRSRDHLTNLLDELGTGNREAGVVADVRREPDRVRARLLVARALLADELDRRWLADLPATKRIREEALSPRKLDFARSTGIETLARRPASWQARMIVAGSTYLLRSRRGDPNLWSDRSHWEQPLISAMEKGPSQFEPARILGAAYLNEWSLMNQEEKRFAVEVLRTAFRNRTTLDQLLAAWLDRADSLERAFAIIPADTLSWKRVENYFRAKGDWERVCQSRIRSRAILSGYLGQILDEAGARLAGGDLRGARIRCLQVFESLPVGPEYVQTLTRMLETLPPGIIPPRAREQARVWLEWTYRECLLNTCPISEVTARRLRDIGQFSTSPDAAWMAEIAGDLYSAGYYDRTALAPNTEEWTPYLLLKANRLIAEDKTAEALQALSLIHPKWADRAIARSVRRRIRDRLAPAAETRVDHWQSEAISHNGSGWFREYFWRAPPSKVRLRFGQVDPSGAAVEISWSARFQECRPVDSGASLSVGAPATGGYHVLEIRPVAGARARPLAIDLMN